MPIKYCIWDVGNVIYDYSLQPLAEWIDQHSAVTPENPLFDFKPYMKGMISTTDMMRQLCLKYRIVYSGTIQKRLTELFWEGIGEYYAETRKIQETLQKNGILNCLLSNALPILYDSHQTENIIESNHIFASYDLGLLKPDRRIYQTVLRKLDAAPQETIFVDDKPANVLAAQDIGIHGIVFNRATIAAEIQNITGIRIF